MTRPNLFTHAPSELSQDAVLCWLLAWSAPEAEAHDPALHGLAASFVQACFAKHSVPAPERIVSIRVERQVKNIDILATVNEQSAILIEDKTFSTEHSNQLERYLSQLNDAGAGYDVVLPIYVQTGHQSSHKGVTDAGYEVLSRRELLDLLEHGIAEGCSNAIVVDFRDYLAEIERSVESFRSAPLDQWDNLAWQGFYMWLQGQLGQGDWGYVPNQSGGFLGFWWCRHSGEGLERYLQIEESRLCAKISVPDPTARAALKRLWSERMIAAGQRAGIRAEKPTRLKSGKSMTVAILGDNSRVPKPDGSLDLEGTLRLLKSAEQVLVDAGADGH